MALDWASLEKVVGSEGLDLWSVIKPYLPALAREGPDVYEGFIKHLVNKEWGKIDALMYEKMTIAERRELEDQVLKDARDAAIARVNRIALYKNVAFKLFLRVAMVAALG